MLRFLAVHIVVACVGFSTAWAAPSEASGEQPPALSFGGSDSLVDIARASIRARARDLGVYAPLTATVDSKAIIQNRIAALYEADTYMRSVITGLAGAGPDEVSRAMLRDELTPLQDEHEQLLFAALLDTLGHASVADHGWFTTSHFGAETEHRAGVLLATGRGNRAFLIALQQRFQKLFAQHDVSAETRLTIDRLLAEPVTASARVGERAR